ncbi:ribonuclease H-like domain-containing protein [Tanacetum coccineum]
MSTSNTHQQSLVDVGSETRLPMLERGSYIPWASYFRRYLNRKRENKKWLSKAIDEGPYEFRIFTPSDTEAPRMQKEEDLRGDDLKHYEAEIEAMNLIIISIPNNIYNSMDACKTEKAMCRNSGNDGRNTRRLYVQEEIIEGNNVQNDAGNIQRTLQITSLRMVANVQCYNCSEKGHYACNCPKPRVRDSKYFMK